MRLQTIVASEAGIVLDSNVKTGGGTDMTSQLQVLLDRAGEDCALHLILDGAALVRGLRLHSNTTLECPNTSCGLYLADHSDVPLLRNSCEDTACIRQENIAILGGTYNHNCRAQAHDVPCPEGTFNRVLEYRRWVVAMEFFGVRNLTVRDVTILNQRCFAFLLINWHRVTLENITIPLTEHMDAENQDGINIWGPGSCLTLRNIRGRSGDDFIAITPDQLDGVSSVEDVLVDGVQLENADQGIRLLSRGTGRLDRVTLCNISGSYRSFGFYINPWFPDGEGGNFGNILIENVDLRQTEPNYTYTEPMLFRLGGNIECITFRNIRHHNPADGRKLFQIGIPCCEVEDPAAPRGAEIPQRIGTVIVDGLTVTGDRHDTAYFGIYDRVEHLILRHTAILREGTPSGTLLHFGSAGRIGVLHLHDLYTERLKVLSDAPARIGQTVTENVLCSGAAAPDGN